jgi:hypothetical protein
MKTAEMMFTQKMLQLARVVWSLSKSKKATELDDELTLKGILRAVNDITP